MWFWYLDTTGRSLTAGIIRVLYKDTVGRNGWVSWTSEIDIIIKLIAKVILFTVIKE